MKKLYNWFGGRALLNNDLEAFQEQLDGQASLHYGNGAYLISGGAVTSIGGGLYNVAEALIVINNKLVLMPAQNSVVLTANTVVVQIADVTLFPRPFAIWSSVLPGVRRTVAQIKEISTVTAGSGQFLQITPNGFMRNYADAQRDMINLVDEVKHYIGASTNFDANGAGIGNLKGWQICNGTGGFPDCTGRFLVAKKTGDINFATTTQIGGSKNVTLTIPNLPVHSHTIQNDSNAHTHTHKFPATKMVGENLGTGEPAADPEINNAFDNNTGGATGNHNHGGVTGDTGLGNPFSVLNPYFVVECVIVWVGNSQYHGSI